jgi:Cu(I)/Ag(I) efflux system protein CusF
MNPIARLAAAAAFILSSASLAFAQGPEHSAHHASSSQIAQNEADAGKSAGVEGQMAEGEVRKVDKEAGKITIRHGELKNLGMPAMTMVFRVKSPAMLDQVKPGDKVKFIAEKLEGAFTLVKLENV